MFYATSRVVAVLLTGVVFFVSGLAGGAPAASAAPHKLSAQEARHLINRTGFGASPAEIDALTGMPRTQAVDLLLGGVMPNTVTPMPDWTRLPPYPMHDIWALGNTQGELFIANRGIEIDQLSAWWIGEMIATPSPLTERLVLFWHDHFATSFLGVENSQWMAAQNQVLRRHAAGNYRDLMQAMLRDPALLTFLSNVENQKNAPNEDLAREFFELFTLGEGRGYTEEDIRETARALTGYTVSDIGVPQYRFVAARHDGGIKTILGQQGRFGAEDLTELALSHPAFGAYIVEKLWLEFVSATPDQAEIERLATLWREADWAVRPLLRALLLTDAFWDETNRGQLVKSPVEMLVSAVRTLGLEVRDTARLSELSADMGQALFMPPNVGGWPHGSGWINDGTIASRVLALAALTEVASSAMAGGAGMMASGADGMMMRLGKGASSAPSEEALQIGQIFALNAANTGDGIEATLALFDVSFAGQRYHVLPLWFEKPRGEAARFSFYVADCNCLRALPRDENESGWRPFVLSNPFLSKIESDLDRALLNAIASTLPQLIAETEGQRLWTRAEAVDMAALIEVSEEIAGTADSLMGPSDHELVVALSAPGLLGLTDPAINQTGPHAARPPVVYSSLDDWASAIPATMDTADVLLAVSPRDLASNSSSEETLMRLLLAPEFQVK